MGLGGPNARRTYLSRDVAYIGHLLLILRYTGANEHTLGAAGGQSLMLSSLILTARDCVSWRARVGSLHLYF